MEYVLYIRILSCAQWPSESDGLHWQSTPGVVFWCVRMTVGWRSTAASNLRLIFINVAFQFPYAV
jgi:hypothetical protein